MKKLLALLLSITLLSACELSHTTTSSEEPETLEELKAALTKKKQSLNELEVEMQALTDKIAVLDPSLQEKSKLVDTSMMKTEDFVRYINIQGAVKADDPVNAVSDMGGRISRLFVKEGDFIRKGAMIAKLDVATIESQINEINSSLGLAKDVYERQERLWSKKIGSEVQYLQAKNNVERLEKSLETINLQLSKANIYAPISGTVDMVMTNQGEVASPGMPIVQLLNTSKLKIGTDLPENYLKIVKKGMTVDLDFPSIDFSTSGRVSLLGRQIDPANRTLELEIQPKKSSDLLKPNLLAEIKIKEYSTKDAVFMPLEYILQEVDGTQFVYVAETDEEGAMRAKKRYVQIGEAAEGNVIITEGLATGEAVIFRGSRNVSDGELINFSK